MTANRDRWPDVSGRIVDGVHVLPVRVYYEDTDFSGRVYHASYLRFCERGRSELLRAAGLTHTELAGRDCEADATYFAVRHMTIDFLAPASIDDLLEVESRFAGASGARLRIDQEIRCGSARIFFAQVTVVALGKSGRPRRIPHGIAERMKVGNALSTGRGQ